MVHQKVRGRLSRIAWPNANLCSEGEIIHELFHSPDWRAIFLSFCIDDSFQRKQNEFCLVSFCFVQGQKRINRWIRTGVWWTLCGWDSVCKLQLRRVCSHAVKEMLKWATRQCHHQSEWRVCSGLSVQKSSKRQIWAGGTLTFRCAPGNQDR